MASNAACIFCKIIKNEIPSIPLFSSSLTYAFLDINPLSKGHALIIPKHHGAKLTDIPDDSLSEILRVAKKIAGAQSAVTGVEDYNILQNNGRAAHQLVDHVHFHVIPKPNEQEGLGVGWPMGKSEKEEMEKLAEQLRAKM